MPPIQGQRSQQASTVNLGSGNHAYWDGAAWQAGEMPAPAPAPDPDPEPDHPHEPFDADGDGDHDHDDHHIVDGYVDDPQGENSP